MIESSELTSQPPPFEAMAEFYALLSRAFAGNIIAKDLPIITEVTEMPISVEDFGIEHFSTFGRELFLWHSFYTSQERMIGGPTTELYALCYKNHAIDFHSTEQADHIATIFECIGAACSKKDAMAISELSRLTIQFWPFILNDLQKYCTQSIFLPMALWADELLKLCLELTASTPPNITNHQLDSKELGLNDKETGLADIAKWFATPANCGINLTPRAIKAFSSQENIPHGFGSRWQIIENLLTGLSDYGRLGEFWNHIEAIVQSTQFSFETYSQTHFQPQNTWHHRWQANLANLKTLREQTNDQPQPH